MFVIVIMVVVMVAVVDYGRGCTRIRNFGRGRGCVVVRSYCGMVRELSCLCKWQTCAVGLAQHLASYESWRRRQPAVTAKQPRGPRASDGSLTTGQCMAIPAVGFTNTDLPVAAGTYSKGWLTRPLARRRIHVSTSSWRNSSSNWSAAPPANATPFLAGSAWRRAFSSFHSLTTCWCT